MSSTVGRESPIKRPRSRHGGETLRQLFADESDRFFFGGGFGGALVVVALTVLGFEVLGYSIQPRLTGIVWLVAGVGIIALSYRRLRRRGRPLRQGLAGEESVADDLRDLESHGYSVFHDLPSRNRPGANIDHVVIGPGGVFAIETKTWSKGKGEQIDYDGNSIRVGGRPRTTDPISQARAVADDLSQLLDSQPVVPVVMFPGWNVRTVAATHWDYDVVVTTTRYFVTGLVQRKVRQRLNSAQVSQTVSCLLGFISGAASAPAR